MLFFGTTKEKTNHGCSIPGFTQYCTASGTGHFGGVLSIPCRYPARMYVLNKNPQLAAVKYFS